MPVKILSRLLTEEDKKRRLQFQIAFQCAPLLKRMKVACIFNIDKELFAELPSVLRGTTIFYKILSVKNGKYLILFYRHKELEAHLSKKDVQIFLSEYEYKKTDQLDEMLKVLSMRMQESVDLDKEFPHEIGAFLEYPIEDVKHFIACSGKESLLVGYWKVYTNLQEAKKIFKEYDGAKQCAIGEFIAGKSMKEIACA